MRPLFGVAAATILALLLLVPVALAADPLPHNGRVLLSGGGDITLPAGEHADAVIVVNGTATILGEANTVVAIDGAARLLGAHVETVVAVRSPIEIGPDTVVQGDVMTYDSLVHQTGNAEVTGEVKDVASFLVGAGLVLAPALFLLWIGFGLAGIAAGLLLAAIAGRQVRDAEELISREPGRTILTGLVGLIAIPIVSVLLIITVVGAPLGLGILLMGWPLVALVGYLVAGIWIGHWVLRQSGRDREASRPFVAAAVGVLVLEALAIVPVLSIVVGLASLFGFGAVIRLSLRTIRAGAASARSVPGPEAAPVTGAIH
jgi:hypothetical protein